MHTKGMIVIMFLSMPNCPIEQYFHLKRDAQFNLLGTNLIMIIFILFLR
jgi:hypothetical protein